MSLFLNRCGFVSSLCIETVTYGIGGKIRSNRHCKLGCVQNVYRYFMPRQQQVYYCTGNSNKGFQESVDANQKRSYEVVRPRVVGPIRTVPSHIVAPNYRTVKIPARRQRIDIKTEIELIPMRESCALAKRILDFVESRICVGMTTDEIDRMAHVEIIKHNAYPSPLLYNNFPKSVCTSVNNVACHGIPDDRPLADGDIVNVDVTVFYKGYHGDCSATFPIGNVDEGGLRLIECAKQCRDEAIRACGPGKRLSIIGKTISGLANSFNLRVVSIFCGHGIGTYFHGQPDIFHFDNDFSGRMIEGMTFTIEPVLSEGNDSVVILEDDWTAVTTDDSRTAQFEHTILITGNGSDILTK